MKNRLLKSETEFCIDKNLQILAFKGRKTVLLLASSHNCRFIISLFLHHAEIILSIWSRALKPFHNDAIYCSPFCSPCLGTIGRSYQEREWKTAQSNGEFPEDNTSPGNESQLIRPTVHSKTAIHYPPPPPAHPINSGHVQGTSQNAAKQPGTCHHYNYKGLVKPYFLELDTYRPLYHYKGLVKPYHLELDTYQPLYKYKGTVKPYHLEHDGQKLDLCKIVWLQT